MIAGDFVQIPDDRPEKYFQSIAQRWYAQPRTGHCFLRTGGYPRFRALLANLRTAVLHQSRQFVYTTVLQLKELFRGKAIALKTVLAQHIGQLTLFPKQTPQGAFYEVSGVLELLPSK